ncbi:MAG: prephenate dehydratase [Actinobacteria bacterium]|nr:prephenate dehydratase [Actinomycetota bacterium]
MVKIGYLGPAGTFTEEALLYVSHGLKIDPIAFLSVEDVARAVEVNEVDLGIVPIENSIEGSVNATLDMLIFESEVKIVGEIIHQINNCLLINHGSSIERIKEVFSHPHALAQCRKHISSNLKNVVIRAANSTAEAARLAAEAGLSAAAIGNKAAAEIYGLEVLQEHIEDFADNKTRFALLGNKVPKKSKHDKTSIACFLFHDRPGSLLQMLQEFAFRYINLTKIESRPSKRGLGQYVFLIDMEGHIDDPDLSSAIKCLTCKIDKVKFLGSYPRNVRMLSEIEGIL